MTEMSSAMSLCPEKLTPWILVEGSPRPTQFLIDSPPNLDDLACKLCKERKYQARMS